MDLSLLIRAGDVPSDLLLRTIQSLIKGYQRDLDGVAYEILVIETDAGAPVDVAAAHRIAPDLRVIRAPGAKTLAAAFDAAVQSARAPFLGLFSDGACLASPGLLCGARDAWRADPGKAIGTLTFHLGPDDHVRSAAAGYGRGTEEALLQKTGWHKDGYRLFEVSHLADSAAQGWYGALADTHGLFLDRGLWDRVSRAEGDVLWHRAIAVSDRTPWVLLGEGMIRQAHSVATAPAGPPPDHRPRLIGSMDPALSERFGTPAPPPRLAPSVRGRAFAVDLPPRVMERVQAGTLRTTYAGLRFAKNPFDQAIYLQLLQRLKPRTVFEVGTSEGGSAVWFRDQMAALGLPCEILTMDIDPPEMSANGIRVFQVDSTRPGDTFPHEAIRAAMHPWLLIEDSAHTYDSVCAVLDYFHDLLCPGDYVAVEDGVVADLHGAQYRAYADGPNRAVRDFLLKWPEDYAIDEGLCDFYGHNVTYCPNGWLYRR